MSTDAARLGGRLRELLDAEIPAGGRVALLDYPNHRNVGDSAIWLGEVAYLAERGCEIAYHCDLRSYDPRHLRRRADVELLLLHGGGNLGDVWLPHQLFRERVLADFPDRRIVQLPQTIHFDGSEHVERTKRVFAAHASFTLMVRDARSQRFAQERLDCSAVLCPDSAFALGALERPAPPDVPVLWLGRTDHESAVRAESLDARDGELQRADWIGVESAGPVDLVARKAGELLAATLGGLPAPPSPLERALWRDWEWLGRSRVANGCALLARGRVVVTDRLHAHILCLLLGIPHVALDNSYGKLSSFTTTWSTLGDRVRWADTPAEALALARELLDAQPPT